MSPTTLESKEITEVLTSLGLNDKEQRVYLELLSRGPQTATPLGRSLQLPPTTVQAITARLHKDGYLATTKRKSRHVYDALDPTIFKRRLEEKIKDVTNILPLLQSLKNEENTSTTIRIYYRERMADIFHEALRAKPAMIYEIVAAKELQEILGEKFHFTRRRVAAGIPLKSLRVETREIKKYTTDIHKKELREAKFLPRELTFHGNILFWGTTVAFFSAPAEGIACTIKSASIREMIEQLFNLLWSVSRRMETGKTL